MIRIRFIHLIRQALGYSAVRVIIHPFVYVPMVVIRAMQKRARVKTLSRSDVTLTSAAQLDSFFSLFTVVKTNIPLVRIGGKGDGGYIVPDDFDGISACFSPGISTMVDFELAMAHRNIPSYMADASVKFPPTDNPLFDFEPIFLGAQTLPGWISLGDWVSDKHPDAGDLLLQIDIEGGEWPVLEQVSSDLLRRFRIIVIELHDLHELFDAAKFTKIHDCLAKLLEHFTIVHIHPNNIQDEIEFNGYRIPPVIEMSLIRKDRVSQLSPIKNLPIALDRKNNPHISDVLFAPYWYE